MNERNPEEQAFYLLLNKVAFILLLYCKFPELNGKFCYL